MTHSQKNASTMTRRKTDRNGKKTTQNVSKSSRKSDNKRLLSRNKNKTKRRAGDTEAYVNKTGRPQDKCLQNGGTTVFMTWKLRQSTKIDAPYTRGRNNF